MKMTIFHLFAGIIFAIAFMQGMKAGILGILIGSAIGIGAALAFFYSGFILYEWLPKRLGIYELTRYKEKHEQEKLSAKDKAIENTYMNVIIIMHLVCFILCSLCSFYFTKLLL